MKGNFKNRCPRHLSVPPTASCPLGVEHMLAQQENVRRRDPEERGCLWGVASAAHGNCFWTLIRSRSDEDGRMEPFPDAEICALLGISHSMLEKTMTSAIAKLKANKDSEEMQDFREAVLEAADRVPTDNTMYMPDNFRIAAPSLTDDPEEQEEIPEDLMPPEKKRRGRSMPTHRDGRKSDLFGLYSRKTLEKMKKK